MNVGGGGEIPFLTVIRFNIPTVFANFCDSKFNLLLYFPIDNSYYRAYSSNNQGII